jgi:hypothetical protein
MGDIHLKYCRSLQKFADGEGGFTGTLSAEPLIQTKSSGKRHAPVWVISRNQLPG